jgi:hypothetical protein
MPMSEPGDGQRNLKHIEEEKIGRAREKNPTVGVVGQGSSTHTIGSSSHTPSN